VVCPALCRFRSAQELAYGYEQDRAAWGDTTRKGSRLAIERGAKAFARADAARRANTKVNRIANRVSNSQPPPPEVG
jgi:hypothetical protein